MDAVKQKILDRALPQVRAQGWGSLAFAALDEAELYFAGVLDLALFHIKQGDGSLQASPALAPETMKMREKIADLIWQRLSYDDRELTQKTARFLALPLNIPAGTKALLGTSSAIWQQASKGDSGFSYYTKRVSLSVIYANSILFYISAQGKDDEAVKVFIKKEIDLLLKTMSFFNRKESA